MIFDTFTLFAGPCVLECDDLNLRIAESLAQLSQDLDLPVVFKASFDKANRTHGDAPRGPGWQKGLGQLQRVRTATGLPVMTDVHEAWQAEAAEASVDVLQIPAFLCRQTDLIVAAGATGRAVNIKRGQWMSPEAMAGAVEKAEKAGASEVYVTERGTFFGYGDLVVDMRSFLRIRRACGVPVIFDGTHSVQRPGRGGDPEHTPALVRAAVAAGCDGLFLEVHPEPLDAPSDSSNMLPLGAIPLLMKDVLAIQRREERGRGSRTPRPPKQGQITPAVG